MHSTDNEWYFVCMYVINLDPFFTLSKIKIRCIFNTIEVNLLNSFTLFYTECLDKMLMSISIIVVFVILTLLMCWTECYDNKNAIALYCTIAIFNDHYWLYSYSRYDIQTRPLSCLDHNRITAIDIQLNIGYLRIIYY